MICIEHFNKVLTNQDCEKFNARTTLTQDPNPRILIYIRVAEVETGLYSLYMLTHIGMINTFNIYFLFADDWTIFCPSRLRRWGSMGPNVVTNFSDTLLEQLLISRLSSEIVPSAYDPWG